MKPKRLISLLVAVCMMITMLPLSAVTAFAANTSPSWSQDKKASSGGYMYAYKVNDGNATITRFLGPVDSEGNVDSANPGPYDIEIPTELGGFPVTGLGKGSFELYVGGSPDPLCNNIRSVKIPQGVTSIGDYAFYDCRDLKSVTISQGVTSIGDYAFDTCSALTSVTIPQSVTSIGDHAFAQCWGFLSVTINDATTSIGDSAFGACVALTTLKLGEHITTIGEEAFLNCFKLPEVTIPQSVTSIGRGAFNSCDHMTSVTIEDATTSIGKYAFYDCTSLTTLKLGEHITTIDDHAFYKCSALDNVTIPQSVTSIGDVAFGYCKNLKTLSLGNIETLGAGAFYQCSSLRKIIIPENVKEIKSGIIKADGYGVDFEATFGGCSKLEYIMLPAGLTSFEASLSWMYDCSSECVIYYNIDRATANKLLEEPNYSELKDAVQEGHKLLCLCHVTFDANGGNLTDSAKVPVYETEKITDTKANELTSISDPTRAGYKFTGWYTKDDQPFDVNETAITEDITLHAGWEFDPNAPGYCPLTVTGGIVTVKNGDKDVTDTLTVTTDEATGKKTYYVPDGAKVTVTLDKTPIPEGMVFDIWSTGKFSLPLGQDYKAETITFTMNSGVDIAAQYRDASIEDDGPNVLGTAAIIGTAAVGGAVLGYQAYSLGAEFAGKLMALPYFPSNRSALAMMLWEDAGKPMPESELLYPDVGQEERDMDLQHAARWAMENELIPDLNDEGTAPEEMKFYPDNAVSKIDVLKAWQKAQELKNN